MTTPTPETPTTRARACTHDPLKYWELGCDVVDTTATDGPEMQPRQSVFLECLHADCYWILRDREALEYVAGGQSSELRLAEAEDDSNRVIGNLEKALGIEYGLRQRAEEACNKDHPVEPEWTELLVAGKAWAETMTGDNPAYSTRARRLYRAIRALAPDAPKEMT